MSRRRNPNDLIKIEDAIKVFCRKTCHPGVACPDIYCKEMWDEFEDVERVDVVPVVHGRWEWNGEAFICSACGNGHKGQPTIMGQPMFEFCPMCGADMRKDGERG